MHRYYSAVLFSSRYRIHDKSSFESNRSALHSVSNTKSSSVAFGFVKICYNLISLKEFTPCNCARHFEHTRQASPDLPTEENYQFSLLLATTGVWYQKPPFTSNTEYLKWRSVFQTAITLSIHSDPFDRDRRSTQSWDQEKSFLSDNLPANKRTDLPAAPV